jgi:hypothetical protein
MSMNIEQAGGTVMVSLQVLQEKLKSKEGLYKYIEQKGKLYMQN